MLHQVGVGALGPVFRTYEPARDRLVAVKVFRLDITPEQAQALADELARAAEAGLFHPSIVEPIAAGVQGTVAYRAEEYVPAESLDVAMRHYAPASPDKVLPFVTQIAGAIDFARAAGVGHGALHPRDIFVTPDEARVTGFGVVEALERVGLRAPVRRPYSPPERIAGEAWGAAADVFSLAAIAFEMLTARRPSGTGSQIGDLKEPSAGPHAERIRAVLARAMTEDPAGRFPNALGFAAALEAAARGEDAAAPVASARPAEEPGAVAPMPFPAPVAPPDTPGPSRVGREPEPELRAAVPPADDISAEVEEDIAHWDLAREEQQQAEEDMALRAGEPGPAAPLFSEEDAAAADRLTLDAADLVLQDAAPEPPHATAFEAAPPAEEPPAASPPPARDRAFAPVMVPPVRAAAEGRSRHLPDDSFDRPLSLEQSGESRIVVERARTAMLPVAVGVIVGLLLGFLGGYTVASRGTPAGTDAADLNPPPSADTPSQAAGSAPAGKEWSEQTVAQGPQGTARPPSAPDVPPDGPAERPTTGGTAPAPAAPVATRGRLVVRSTPSKAGVTVNGRWRGRTPLTLEDLAFGDYVVRIVQDGYRVEQQDFTLSASDPSRTVSMRLEREAPPAPSARPSPSAPTAYFGSVYVDSRPQGATVYLSGKAYGKTPLRIPEVPVGSHVVRLELVDHRSWTNTVRVTAGQEVRATGSLEPIR